MEKSKNKQLIMFGLLGVAAYFLLKPKTTTIRNNVPYNGYNSGGFVGPGYYQVQQQNGNWVTALIQNADDLIAATSGLITAINQNQQGNNMQQQGGSIFSSAGGRVAGYLNVPLHFFS